MLESACGQSLSLRERELIVDMPESACVQSLSLRERELVVDMPESACGQSPLPPGEGAGCRYA